MYETSKNGILCTHQKDKQDMSVLYEVIWNSVQNILSAKKRQRSLFKKIYFIYIYNISGNAYKKLITVAEGGEFLGTKVSGGFLDTVNFFIPCMFCTIYLYFLFKNTFNNLKKNWEKKNTVKGAAVIKCINISMHETKVYSIKPPITNFPH